MGRLKKKLKDIRDRLVRKVFWLPESQVEILAREAKRLNLPNDSVLMRQIISNMFEK